MARIRCDGSVIKKESLHFFWPHVCSGNKPLPGTWDYKAMNLRIY